MRLTTSTGTSIRAAMADGSGGARAAARRSSTIASRARAFVCQCHVVTGERDAIAGDDAAAFRKAAQDMIEHRRRCVCEQALTHFLSRHPLLERMAGVIPRDGRDQCLLHRCDPGRGDQDTGDLDHLATLREAVDERLTLIPRDTGAASSVD